MNSSVRTQSSGRLGRLVCILAVTALLAAPAGLAALQTAGASARADTVPSDGERPDTVLYHFSPIVVTATRTPRPLAEIPAPVSVLDRTLIQRESPNTVTDLFRELPGLDVNGVGVNQARPVIRGQRGQRILLLEDGIRLNNSRRQQDFGELPALVDVSALERVEVVRGPSSVLYGTDAIGGVVNLITRGESEEGFHGSATYRFAGVEEQHKATAELSGRFGAFDLAASGMFRDAGAYSAPAGSFGGITLADETVVQQTGVQDQRFDARVGYRPSRNHRLFVKGEVYGADDAGFGFVDPADYAPDEPEIAISYPFQDFWKVTLGYGATELANPLADRLDVVTYVQSNERRLDFDLFTEFGPGTPPGAGIRIETENFSDLDTWGGRIEAKKLAADGVLLTYGLDFFRDDSRNTDRSVTTVVGFGPPQSASSDRPQVPNATYRSIGLFAQGELEVGERGTLVLGGRFQDTRAQTRETPGLSDPDVTESNRAVVGAANFIYEIAPGLSGVASVGRAFRSPNLIELFFNGPTPEGSGYQVLNPDLEPETSFNTDLGIRYQTAALALEGFVFRNTIRDGIRIEPTGDEIDGVPAFRNVNVDKLIFKGVEVAADVFLPRGLSVGGSYTHLSEEDALDPNNPVGESFSSKISGHVRYDDPGDLFWGEWEIRHNGDRKDVELVGNPLGDVLPSFTVQDLRAGIRLFRTRGGHVQRLGIAVTNLTNELYAEFSNASFFRPEPKRNVVLTWQVSF